MLLMSGSGVLAAALRVLTRTGRTADDEVDLPAAAGAIVNRWCAALTRAFVADGFDEPEAAALAVTAVAAQDGAILLCRSTGNAEPLRQASDQMCVPQRSGRQFATLLAQAHGPAR